MVGKKISLNIDRSDPGEPVGRGILQGIR